MRSPYTTLLDPEASKQETQTARTKILEEIAEAQHHTDNKNYFLDVWRNIEEATLIAYKEQDYELYNYLKNNWEIMKLDAEKPRSKP